MVTGNLFAKVPQQLADEAVEELLSAPNVTIERIVSMGHATAADEWYDQGRAEWVLLRAGAAGLLFEGDTEPHTLVPGSYVHIPAHRRHRTTRCILGTDRYPEGDARLHC
jgi:cupin 2 domain-containing protein